MAHSFEIQFKEAAERTEEKIIDEPTYPKYKIGGWIANAGSCKIGLRPNPSSGIGKIKLNGLEVFIKKTKKPIMIICWNNNVNILYFLDCSFDFNKNTGYIMFNNGKQMHGMENKVPETVQRLTSYSYFQTK